jgi:hypothetical protein
MTTTDTAPDEPDQGCHVRTHTELSHYVTITRFASPRIATAADGRRLQVATVTLHYCWKPVNEPQTTWPLDSTTVEVSGTWSSGPPGVLTWQYHNAEEWARRLVESHQPTTLLVDPADLGMEPDAVTQLLIKHGLLLPQS